MTQTTDFKLTASNYHSQEANERYLSAHNLMDYMEDPSMFWLKNKGKLTQTTSPALVAGTLFHAFVESEKAFMEVVDEEQNTIFNTRSKTITKDKRAVDFIENGEIEKLVVKYQFNDVWDFVIENWEQREKIWGVGEYEQREVIITGELFGVPFKGMIDKLIVKGDQALIYDYKTAALRENWQHYWNDDLKKRVPLNFLQVYNYDLQMTIYRALVSKKYNIPLENVKVQLGVLVKKGKVAFAEYESGFIETTLLDDEDLLAPRFGHMQTAEDVIETLAPKAYELMKSDELPSELAEESLLYNLSMPASKRQLIDPKNIKI